MIDLTGPGVWNKAIFWNWKAWNVNWTSHRSFGDQSKIIGDQLVFPITSFSPGLNEILKTEFGSMGSKSIHSKDARVRHAWAGSWRNS